MPFTFQPMPHKEARDRIAGLPLVTRGMMDEMLPELRAYAFCITGLDVGDELAKVRDEIASVPMGAKTWAQARKTIAADLTEGLGGKKAERRAELLLRTHVFRGYAAARYRNLMQQVDVFPYWQYKTHGDGNVRPSHLALNRKIFPAGHDIWQRIFPPWDWGCRCLVVPLTRGAVERMQNDGMKAPEQDGSLLKTQISKPELFTGREADLIATAQKLPDGTPLNHAQTWASAPWSIPGNIRHDWPLIQKRYADQPEVLEAFKTWAKEQEIEPGVTVSMWLGDGVATKKVKGAKAVKGVKKVKPAKTATKPSANVDEALAIAQIDPAQVITEAQAAALIDELREDAPASALAQIAQITGASRSVILTETFIRQEVQAFMDFIPPNVAAALPKLEIDVRVMKSLGSYAKGGRVKLSLNNLANAERARRTIFHELAHWLHLEQPDDSVWVKEIKDHFTARTAGEKLKTLPGYHRDTKGKRDKWWEAYMGRIYGTPDEATHLGSEFPTRNMELLADPARLAQIWSQSAEARTDIQLALKGLYL
jgi:SPP1 gp7 family putative phage head morphogenesis protein